jgi:oxaloacetate decarboxylase beta subunit
MNQAALEQLLAGLTGVTWQSVVMLLVVMLLVFLAIAKRYEPLLLPIGVGAILANIPLGVILANDTGRLCKQVVAVTPDPALFQCHEPGLLSLLYQMGVGNEMFPLLIFIGIGAMTDFGLLMRAMGANAAGQVASCAAGG